MKKLYSNFNLRKKILLTGLLWLLVGNVFALDKTINVYVGSTFTFNPWYDLQSTFPGYTCAATSYQSTDASAFSINESSRTKTRYPYYNNSYMDGYYCSYNAKALKTGNYIITGRVSCYKRSASELSNGIGTVTYHVIVKEKPKVVSITIPSSITLQVDETYSFSPVISETGASTTLTWTSSNTSVVTANGPTIKALAPGQSTITCTASNGVSAQCVVTVPPIPVTGISLDMTSVNVNIGEQTTITANLSPDNASNKQVEWSSSDPSVAIVSYNGTVTGISEGFCNINALAKDGSGVQTSCLVQVTKPLIFANTITLGQSLTSIKVGQVAKLVAIIAPSDVSNANILWTSSNPECASVNDDGIVCGLEEGSATITATTTDGTDLSATCVVNVLAKGIEDYDNTIYTENSNGCAGGMVIIPIKMKNSNAITGFQFNILLPDGFSVVKVARGERIKTKLNDEYVYSFDSAPQADGSTFVLCYSIQNVDINGNDGEVALVTVSIPDNIAVGDYPVTLKAIELSKAGSSIITEEMTSKLTVGDYMPGDANGDGRISVADLTSIASHLMGNSPAGFNISAADANGDGRISVADLTTIADQLMNAQ